MFCAISNVDCDDFLSNESGFEILSTQVEAGIWKPQKEITERYVSGKFGQAGNRFEWEQW